MADFLIWWMTVLVLGVVFMPLTGMLFSKFEDRGWIFSKAIGVFVSGYILWVLSCLHILKFTQTNAHMIVMSVLFFLCGVQFLKTRKKKKQSYSEKEGDGDEKNNKSNKLNFNIKLIIIEETLFFAVFAIWSYLVSFDPAAYGTEKFMDYGFMTSMIRTDYFPSIDPWYSGEPMNYYYGGQYMAAFLSKLSGVNIGKSYNFARTMITTFSFMMPFSIVWQLLERMQVRHKKQVREWICNIGGLLSGLAVSFCGNMHYVFYCLIPTILSHFTGMEVDYYYPNSTRYIGHNPDVPGDETIHEFPAYSSVLGDMHAHMINIMFVFIVVGLALSWALKMEKKKRAVSCGIQGSLSGNHVIEALLQPEILWIGFFTGMFRWTNFWDFPIYYVVGGCVVFFMNLRLYRKSAKAFWLITILQAIEVLAVGAIASLPFTLGFDTIATKVRLTYSHSAFYQLVILWGLPVAVTGAFIISETLLYRRNSNKNSGIAGFFIKLPVEDLFVILMSLCAMGLVLLPEIIYVEDIYTGAYRANTMFKLTYQAFMLFGFSMVYVLIRTLCLKKKAAKIAAVFGLICLILTAGYGVNAIRSRFGDVTDQSRRKGMDASIYVSEHFPTDFEAICWLNEHVSEQAVVLEAQGDSYTKHGRVSVATGLPTVLGWFVHEWLWRGDVEAVKERAEDVRTIYTSTNKDLVKQMISLYDVTYIYIGTLERQKYPELNDLLLQEIGEVVYSNGVDTYILKVQ